MYKVESRLVEVPVLLTSSSGKEIPELSEKDFRIYEDDSLRQTAFFGKEAETRDIDRLRQTAISRARAGEGTPEVRQADTRPMTLGRFYLVLDDLTTSGSAFQQSQLAAERIVREYSHPLRPITLHFMSRGSAILNVDQDVGHMLKQIREAAPHALSNQVSSDEIMNVHEAYLIDRGDQEASGIAELRYAAAAQLTYTNRMGRVLGQMDANPEMVRSMVAGTATRVIAENAAEVNRALDSLQVIINAAAAEEGDYPRTMVILSSGFALERGSNRTELGARLDKLVANARNSGIRVFTVDAGGLIGAEPVSMAATQSFLASNPHLVAILIRHAGDWRREMAAPLQELAGETGGRFFASTNDLTGAAATAMRTGGRIYYLAYTSRQPIDGRFHRIRVTCSAPGVQVYARKGYYARPGEEPAGAEESLEGEDWEAVLARVNEALRAKNLPGASRDLERLVRRFPNETNLWYNLGAVRLQLKQNAGAVDAFQRAFVLSHEDAAAGTALTRALIAAGFPDAAVETMETVIRRHPGNLELLIQLGRTYETASRANEAYQTYRRILDLTLAPPLDVYVLLLRTAVALGRETEAGVFAADYAARGGDVSVIQQWRRQASDGARQPSSSTGGAAVNH